jgi:dTDP-4-amino-4,6-dideoxygalactose transaminase
LATAGAIARTGARPVFSDIEARSFNLDPEEAKDKIGARTRAIVPVDLFGRCADMDPLVESARQRGFGIIEDAAHSFGARDGQGRAAGTIGDMGCLSFSPVRNLGAFGDAGMVITRDAKAAERLRELRTHGGRGKSDQEQIGGNFRLDALQAAVLRVKLGYLPLWTAARRQNAARYRELLGDAALSPWVTAPEDVPGHTYNCFVIRCSERDRLQDFLQKQGIETEICSPVPLHLRECFQHLGTRRGEFPRAEAAAQEALALPMYPELTFKQQSYIIDQMGEFYRQVSAHALRQAS